MHNVHFISLVAVRSYGSVGATGSGCLLPVRSPGVMEAQRARRLATVPLPSFPPGKGEKEGVWAAEEKQNRRQKAN